MKLGEMTEWTDIDEAALYLGASLGLWSEDDDVVRTKIRETIHQTGGSDNVACWMFYLLDDMCNYGFLERNDLDWERDDERMPKMRLKPDFKPKWDR